MIDTLNTSENVTHVPFLMQNASARKEMGKHSRARNRTLVLIGSIIYLVYSLAAIDVYSYVGLVVWNMFDW